MTIEKQTITVYNKYMSMPSNWAGGVPPSNAETWARTVLEDCQFEDEVHRDPDPSGKSFINKTFLALIPQKKRDKPFMPGKEWLVLPNSQKNSYFTLKIGDCIALGETPEITSAFKVANLRTDYKAFEIKEIADLSEGPLPHFEVQGI
jgi:hypothetical protein